MDELKLSPQWREAVRRMLDSGLTYGSVVTKEQLAQLLEVREPRHVSEVEAYNLALLRGITSIRECLLTKHRMMLATNRDGSYRVVMPDQQTDHTVGNGVRAINRELQRMALGLVYTNTEQLTDESRRANADAQAKLAKLATIFKQEAPRPALGRSILDDEGQE